MYGIIKIELELEGERNLTKRKWILLTIPLFLLLIFALTYIPQKVVSIDATSVSKISIFDGNSGNVIEITKPTEIHHIINNLNNVTFQKGKPSFGYSGYSFRTTIFNNKGKTIKELIINSNSTIRYKGFFYTTVDNSIDYNYIEQIVSPKN
jgi:hypothetical protein